VRRRPASRLLTGTAFLLTWLALILASASAALAQDADLGETVNYAFATQIGSGIYRSNGRTLQVYRITATVPLLRPDPGVRAFGLTLRLPTTLGFFGFRAEDLLQFDLPSTIGSLALVPELLAEIPVSENWWLGPFAGLGLGKDFQGGSLDVIYALGLRSQAVFPRDRFDLRLANRLVYSGYTSEDLDFIDDFGLFETGFEARRPIGVQLHGSTMNIGLFAANYLYFFSPKLLRLSREPIEMRTEWELGFTLGTVTPWKILGLTLPRLGLSYRFGSGHDAIRFVFGNGFPIESPEERGATMQ